MQLAVVTAALFGDRLVLQGVEARPGNVELVQYRKRQRQHHEVGDHVGRAAGSLEGDFVPAVRGFLEPRQALPRLDDVATEVAGDGFGQLLIAAADVELLIGLAEDRQRVGVG